MTPCAIALHGIGFSGQSVAMQGFYAEGATFTPMSYRIEIKQRPTPKVDRRRENDEALLLLLM